MLDGDSGVPAALDKLVSSLAGSIPATVSADDESAPSKVAGESVFLVAC